MLGGSVVFDGIYDCLVDEIPEQKKELQRSHESDDHLCVVVRRSSGEWPGKMIISIRKRFAISSGSFHVGRRMKHVRAEIEESND